MKRLPCGLLSIHVNHFFFDWQSTIAAAGDRVTLAISGEVHLIARVSRGNALLYRDRISER